MELGTTFLPDSLAAVKVTGFKKWFLKSNNLRPSTVKTLINGDVTFKRDSC